MGRGQVYIEMKEIEKMRNRGERKKDAGQLVREKWTEESESDQKETRTTTLASLLSPTLCPADHNEYVSFQLPTLPRTPKKKNVYSYWQVYIKDQLEPFNATKSKRGPRGSANIRGGG